MIGLPNRRSWALLLLLLLAFPSVIAEELGRLFFSAEERQVLNQKRSLPAPDKTDGSLPTQKPAASFDSMESVPLPPPKVTGRVTRSSGNDTVWINHQPQYKRGKP